MAPELPGYYFDPVKKKYFKIEKAHTAPPAAAWSADEVKRRYVEDAAAESSRQRKRLLQRHVRRHAVWKAGDLVAARGRLLRELGGSAPAVLEDTAPAAWARGLVDKGSIPFVPSFARARYANLPCLYVGGDDVKTGLGVAYATLDEETLVGSYIATDENDDISFSSTAPEGTGRRQGLHAEMVRCPQISSIRYHQPSHKILVTSRSPDNFCGLYFFSPPLSDPVDAQRPQWLLGETSHYQRLYMRHRMRNDWFAHQSTPAPASSDLLCAIGTNAGILFARAAESTEWLEAGPGTNTATARAPGRHIPQEVFDLDFQTGNHNVLLAGGRQPRLWLTDLRAPPAEWRSVPHASAITHLRSVAEHHVLVAGLRSSMALYDTRFFGRAPNGGTPVLRFDGYRNEAHVHTGWDVCRELGLVAAAHDDGTVQLYSLKTGRGLTTAGKGSGGGGALGTVKADTPIRALMFQRMPRETMPSLWVGEGPLLRKFSLGVGEVGDEA